MLVLANNEQEGLVDMRDALEVVEQALEAWGNAVDENRPRQRVHTGAIRVSVHPGASRELGHAGAYMHCESIEPEPDKQLVGQRPPVAVVYDGRTGDLQGMIIGNLSGIPRYDLRTAATSAYGASLIARPDSEVLGVFGAGKQATGHLRAFCLAMPAIREARVYSPTRERRIAFAERMSQELGRKVFAVDHPREVVEGADVIVGATNSNVALFEGEWLEPGQHVTSIAASNIGLLRSGVIGQMRRELDDTTLERADRIVLLSKEQAVQDGHYDMSAVEDSPEAERVVELRDLATGRAPRDVDPSAITLFLNNGGQGIIDVGIAGRILEVARERGLGTEIDISWLTPDKI